MVHLTSFEVSRFRAFDKLVISHLGRVNLVVGKNNVGKSSLLEALRLFAHRGSPQVIWEILELRNETEVTPPRTTEGEEPRGLALEHLYHNYSGLRNSVEPISIGPKGGEATQLTMSFDWYESHIAEDGTRHWSAVDEADASVDLRPALTVKDGTTLRARLWLDEDPVNYRRRWLVRGDVLDGGIPCTYVSPNGLTADQLGQWWDNIALTGLEDDVLAAMRVIDPRVERISLVALPERPHRDRVPIVKLNNAMYPIPLRSLGDGMNRILGIALALVNAKNGILLVDEIENGIHYSVQQELWRLIIRVSERLNVQVFATSHSWDCIEAFQEAAAENQEVEGLLIRLALKASDVQATVFDERELGIATREQIEVR